MSLISIIVPVYNVENYLNNCIESILNQTYSNFELLLINDGSQDKCGRICEDYAEKDSRIRVFHKRNGGLSDARNYGIDVSRGEYITFIDSDDCVDYRYLEALYEDIQTSEADISIINYIAKDDVSGSFYFHVLKNDIFHKLYSVSEWLSKEGIYEYGFDTVLHVAWGKLYKKSLFENVRYPVGCTSEDDLTTYKLYLLSNKISFRNDGLYIYTINRAGSIMSDPYKQRKSNIDQDIRAIEERMALLSVSGFDISPQIPCYLKRLKHTLDLALQLGNVELYKQIQSKLEIVSRYR